SHPRYPRLRLELRTALSWKSDVEYALEKLLGSMSPEALRRRHPRRAGNTLTHVDSPCHIFWDGTMYNGRSHSLVDAATGSAWAAVTAAANGIITRGVLLDVARVRGVPWLEPGQGVFPDDLEEAERRQGVRV